MDNNIKEYLDKMWARLDDIKSVDFNVCFSEMEKSEIFKTVFGKFQTFYELSCLAVASPNFRGLSEVYTLPYMKFDLIGVKQTDEEIKNSIIIKGTEIFKDKSSIINHLCDLFNYVKYLYNAEQKSCLNPETVNFYNDLYQGMLVYIPFALICIQENKKAIDFMIENYEDLTPKSRLSFLVIINLCRGVLFSEKYNDAIKLYGMLCYELSFEKKEREQQRAAKLGVKLIDYLYSYLEYLKLEYSLRRDEKNKTNFNICSEYLHKTLPIIRAAFEKNEFDRDHVSLIVSYYDAIFTTEDVNDNELKVKYNRILMPSITNRVLPELSVTLTWETDQTRFTAIDKQGWWTEIERDFNELLYLRNGYGWDVTTAKQSLGLFKNKLIMHIDALKEKEMEKMVAYWCELLQKENKKYMNCKNVDEEFWQSLDEDFQNFMLEYGFINERAMYDERISNSQKEFLTAIREHDNSINDDTDLFNKLSDEPETLDKIKSFLYTNYFVADMMSKSKTNTELDYSPCVISLSKTIECILHYIFTKSDIDLTHADNKSYVKDGKLKDFVPGNLAVDFLEVKGDKSCVRNPYIDSDKLNNVKDMDDETIKNIFADANSEKQLLKEFKKSLKQIFDIRNSGGHTGQLDVLSYNKALELCLTGEKLLWILLYIMKE